MIPNELHLLRRLEVLDDARTYGATIDPNRSRFISSLHKKLASGELSEPERIRQAEAAMAASRQIDRDQVHGRAAHHVAHPARTGRSDGGLFALLANKAELADNARIVQAEARAWRREAAARAERTQRRLADLPSGHALAGLRHYRQLGGNVG